MFAHLAPNGTTGIVADLTIGYRVPEPVLTVANRLLPLTGVDATESRSVRLDGRAPLWHECGTDELVACVGAMTSEVKAIHKLTGVVAPERLHDAIAAQLETVGLVAVSYVYELAPKDVPLFGAHEVKGLEFDGVVVVNPHEILGDTPRGARLLYVAMTRAVQRLDFVTDAAPPPVIAD